jgi:RHS repeat-associated protein
MITSDPRGPSFNGALAYLLDGAGNRLSRTSTLPAIASGISEYDANDQLSSDTYDANGNTTAAGGDTFAYDFENRLVSKNSGAVTVQYDCDGNRVAKTVGGVTTRYLVDDLNPTGYLQVLEEVVGGAVQTRYTYGASIVSQTGNVSAAPATSYYGFDAHGNITFLTDAAGAVTDSYDYDGWGVLVASTGSTPNSRLYTGEEFDPDLGLINLRARQYEASAGRFATIDPVLGRVHNPLTFNRYLFANGNPIDLSDPSGRAAPAPSPAPRIGGGGPASEYMALVMFGMILTQTTKVRLGHGERTRSVEVPLAQSLGDKAACNFWKIASEFELIEAIAQRRQAVGPTPPFDECHPDEVCVLDRIDPVLKEGYGGAKYIAAQRCSYICYGFNTPPRDMSADVEVGAHCPMIIPAPKGGPQ